MKQKAKSNKSKYVIEWYVEMCKQLLSKKYHALFSVKSMKENEEIWKFLSSEVICHKLFNYIYTHFLLYWVQLTIVLLLLSLSLRAELKYSEPVANRTLLLMRFCAFASPICHTLTFRDSVIHIFCDFTYFCEYLYIHISADCFLFFFGATVTYIDLLNYIQAVIVIWKCRISETNTCLYQPYSMYVCVSAIFKIYWCLHCKLFAVLYLSLVVYFLLYNCHYMTIYVLYINLLLFDR